MSPIVTSILCRVHQGRLFVRSPRFVSPCSQGRRSSHCPSFGYVFDWLPCSKHPVPSPMMAHLSRSSSSTPRMARLSQNTTVAKIAVALFHVIASPNIAEFVHGSLYRCGVLRSLKCMLAALRCLSIQVSQKACFGFLLSLTTLKMQISQNAF